MGPGVGAELLSEGSDLWVWLDCALYWCHDGFMGILTWNSEIVAHTRGP